MYQMDIEAGFTSPKHCRSVAFSLVKYGAPEGTRTPNLLLRSRKQHPPRRAYWFVVGPLFGFGSEDVHGRP